MGTVDLTSARFWQDQSPHALSEGAPLHLAPPASLLVQTSGSEGKPKWVVLSKHAFLASAKAVNQHIQTAADDRWLIALPLTHVGGFSIFARAFVSGSKVHPFDGRWDAERFVAVCAEQRITLTSMVPTQVFDLVRAQLTAPASLRAVVVGGGGMTKELGMAARDLGWPVLQSYGMTEAASQIATEPLEHLSSGFNPDALEVLPHWSVRVTEGDHLAIGGEALASGYLSKTETGEWHYLPIGSEFVTRDRVELWTDGTRQCLRFLGRESSILKIMGELVHLDALQAKLDALADAGSQCVIVDVPDERRGRSLVLVHDGAADAVTLMDRFNASVAPFERIVAVQEVARIPRSDLGKVRINELRSLVACARPDFY